MLIFDAHCDTLLKMDRPACRLDKNEHEVDIQRMAAAGDFVQVFAACVSDAGSETHAMRRALVLIERYHAHMHANAGTIMHCGDAKQIEQAHRCKKVAALLSIEGGEALAGEISALEAFHRLGVRSLCLTHNARNALANGVHEEPSLGGLTQFGMKVIKKMNQLGMLIDVSHISQAGFWDVIDHTQQPVIASHSNAKALCDHVRNLSNEQLVAIAKNGGVIGINFYPVFLNESGVATIDDILRHMEHIASRIGVDHIGLGSDFDGIEVRPANMNGVQDTIKVLDALAKRNYSQAQIEKIAGGNFMRVCKKVFA